MKKLKRPSLNISILIAFALLGIPVFASYIVPPNGVTTQAIQAGAVTQVKLAPRPTPSMSPNPQPSPSGSPGSYVLSAAGTVTNSTAFPVPIPSNSVTITTTGRPIVVGLMCDSSSLCGVSASAPNAVFLDTITYNLPVWTDGVIYLIRGSSTISRQSFVGETPASAFFYIDYEPAGTYTYSDTIGPGSSASSTGSTTVVATNVKLYAYEQ